MARPLEEPDDVALPAPESTMRLVGQERAEQELLGALKRGQLHHAWLLTGPRGVGKATLAFRFARFLLHHGRDEAAIARATSLDVPEGSDVARQMEAGATQDLLVLRRDVDEKTGKEKTEITVGVARRLADFFGLKSGREGWRVVIVDPADDLNRSAANALLKALEEPPRRALLLLVSHVPGKLLPTIRSRCRKLGLDPLPDETLREELRKITAAMHIPAPSAADETSIARFAEGSLGRALEFVLAGAVDQQRALLSALKSWPNMPDGAVRGVLDALGRKNEAAFDSMANLVLRALHDVARAQAEGSVDALEPGLRPLAAVPGWMWADLASGLRELFAARADLNLDERAVITEALRRIATVRRAAA